jgi:predicted phosphodiesterase
MIRKWLQKILTNPVIRLAQRYSSDPDGRLVFSALDDLYKRIDGGNEKKGLLIPYDSEKERFVIFSDHHKGNNNGADDFTTCEQAYLKALDHYEQQQFHYICLGDCEELWENNLFAVRDAHAASIEKENLFVKRKAFTKIFGNHDLFWDQDPLAFLQLKAMYGEEIKVYEGVIIRTRIEGKELDIFLTHGHQGDQQSDGNWFSKFFVSRIWGPLQAFLRINPNTPAYNSQLKTLHNTLMYEWSAKQAGLLLVTGHTHQPVFESLTLLESLIRRLDEARATKDEVLVHTLEEEISKRRVELPVSPNLYEKIMPFYFNTGCCCFSDGDITGIEIEKGMIRLVKWKTGGERFVLQEKELARLMAG